MTDPSYPQYDSLMPYILDDSDRLFTYFTNSTSHVPRPTLFTKTNVEQIKNMAFSKFKSTTNSVAELTNYDIASYEDYYDEYYDNNIKKMDQIYLSTPLTKIKSYQPVMSKSTLSVDDFWILISQLKYNGCTYNTTNHTEWYDTHANILQYLKNEECFKTLKYKLINKLRMQGNSYIKCKYYTIYSILLGKSYYESVLSTRNNRIINLENEMDSRLIEL